MKSVKLSAKMFLAVAAVASISLTSCEKEDFNVDVPNISFPEINFPDVNEQSGSVYVMLTASDTNGKLLNNVVFDAGEQAISGDMIVITGKETVKLTVTASKDGYLSETKTFDVTPMVNQLISLPVNFVLSTVDVEDVPVVEGVPEVNEEKVTDKVELPKPNSGFVAGKYVAKVQVPTQVPFLSDEQRSALLTAIDNLQPATRDAAADLQEAKEILRAKVASYSSKPETKEQDHEFFLTGTATSVNLVLTSETANVGIVLSTIVGGKTYRVEGAYTIYTKTVIADDIVYEAGHGHGHGHGDDANAGGGSGNGNA